MNKKLNSVSSAETKDDSSTTVQDTSVRQHRSKPNVVRSFLVLTHCGAFVDGNMLEKGIYTTQTPRLYDMVTTIDGLIEAGRIMKDFAGNNFISERYFENLSQCTLSEVTLSLK